MVLSQLLLSIVLLIIGAALGGLGVWLICQNRAQSQAEQLKIQLAGLKTERDGLEASLQPLQIAHQALQEEKTDLTVKVAQLQEARTADAEKLEWLRQAQAQMREAFEALARQTLQSNSDEFGKRTRELLAATYGQFRSDWTTQKAELTNLVDPLKHGLTTLDEHVRTLEQKREGAYQGLQEQLHQLARTHTDLHITTTKLTQALKSPTVRGRWGELQLRRVVEMAGMVKHVTFAEQAGADGSRPDMISYLPNDGILPVDSKVPLESYLEAMEAQEEAVRTTKLANHAKAMRGRVLDLSQKKYWEQFERAPDFVVMFVPNESCLGAAFENDPGLLEYAIGKRVLITTPVTLLALLKAVAYGWQQHHVTENSFKIAEQGKELYRRLEIFVSHLTNLRKSLDRTVHKHALPYYIRN